MFSYIHQSSEFFSFWSIDQLSKSCHFQVSHILIMAFPLPTGFCYGTVLTNQMLNFFFLNAKDNGRTCQTYISFQFPYSNSKIDVYILYFHIAFRCFQFGFLIELWSLITNDNIKVIYFNLSLVFLPFFLCIS